jgi:tRNA(Ile)-lysidine synthase
MTKQSEKNELLIDEELIGDGQPVVLGISGGPDSVCLFLELVTLSKKRKEAGGLGNPITCAHINHGLRGEESDEDEDFVVELCKRYDAGFTIKRIDAAKLARKEGMTVEEVSREVRYALYDEVCADAAEQAEVTPVIAVAHNQDDQVETILMRILRGTGTDGLAGMAAVRKSAAGYDIVRPLLGVTREEIISRLEEYGEKARTDSSNLSTEFFRNRIRLEVIPYLEKTSGFNLRQSLLRLSENATEDRDYFENVVSGALGADEPPPFVSGELTQKEPSPLCSVMSVPAELLATAHPAVRHRMIRAVFAGLGLRSDIAAVHLAAADRLLKTWLEGGEASGKRVEFPLDYTFGMEGKKAVFRSPDAADPNWKPRRKL